MSTIILAEDDQTLRENLAFLLNMEGFKVLSAENGILAYNLAISCHPDLIISDIQMPLMGGFELFNKLQSNPSTASIPLIYISAGNEKITEIKQKILNARAYLMKPFELKELLELIKKYNRSEDNMSS